MKRILAAVILAGAALAAGAAPYAPQEFDFSGLDLSDGTAYGVVEAVHPVQRKEPDPADAFEHSVQADMPGLLIRLDDGSGVTVVDYGPEQFRPGQRVQVMLGPDGLRAEPAGQEP
jgi:hypothetical protein